MVLRFNRRPIHKVFTLKKTKNMENNTVLAQNEFAKKGKIWTLFLLLGWSYGSLGNIGIQMLYYFTLGGLFIWTFIRLFTLNKSIKNYNKSICIRYRLTADEMLQLGVL